MEKQTFTIFTGDDKTMKLKAIYAENPNDPLDLTSCSEIIVNLPKNDGTFAQLKLSEDEVSITPPDLLGKFECPIDGTLSAALNPGELQNVDVTFTIAAKEFTVRFYQALTVLERD